MAVLRLFVFHSLIKTVGRVMSQIVQAWWFTSADLPRFNGHLGDNEPSATDAVLLAFHVIPGQVSSCGKSTCGDPKTTERGGCGGLYRPAGWEAGLPPLFTHLLWWTAGEGRSFSVSGAKVYGMSRHIVIWSAVKPAATWGT